MSRLKSNMGVLVSFLVIFTVTYMPVVQTHYFYVDDYLLVWPNVSEMQLYKQVFLGSIGTGRAIAGYVEYKIFSYVHYLQAVGFDSAIRLVGIIGLALLAYVIFIIFKTNRIKTKYAFIASILICTLPAFQVYISWIILISVIYGMTLSALAGLLLFKVVFNEDRGSSLYRKVAIFIALLLLVISLHFYQSAAMIYWSVGLIPLALLRDRDLTGKWYIPFAVYFSVGFVSLAIHFIIVKTVNFVAGFSAGQRGSFIPLTEKAVYYKIQWFFASPLKNSLNLWNISPTDMLGGIVGIIILVGLLLGLRQAFLQAIKERRFNLICNHALRMLFIISIIPLSILPSLLVIESWATYRTIISLEVSICILFFISLLNVDEFLKSETQIFGNLRKMIIPAILIMLSVFVVYDAHGNVKKYFAELQSLELQYVKNAIREYGISRLSKTSRIYVRNPDKLYFIDNRFRFEFGQPSSNEGFGIYIVNPALYELGIKRKMKISQVFGNAPLPEDSNALIIDFTKLKYVLDERFR